VQHKTEFLSLVVFRVYSLGALSPLRIFVRMCTSSCKFACLYARSCAYTHVLPMLVHSASRSIVFVCSCVAHSFLFCWSCSLCHPPALRSLPSFPQPVAFSLRVSFWVLLFSFASNAGWFAGQCMCGWQYFRYFWELDSGELTDENAYIALSLRVPNTHGQTHKHRDTSAHTHILAHSNARAKHATCTIHVLILPPLLHPALTKKIKKYENNAFRHCFYFCLYLCVYVCECVRV